MGQCMVKKKISEELLRCRWQSTTRGQEMVSGFTLPYMLTAVTCRVSLVVQTVEDSLVVDNSSPQFLDTNYLSVTPPPRVPPLSGLPPELRHLLQSDDRPGEQV